MLELLKELSDNFKLEATEIINYTKMKRAYTSNLFEKPIVFIMLDGRPNLLTGKKGIYIFVIKEDINLTREQVWAWNSIRGAGFKHYTPIDLHKGDCLYLGSCVELSLFVRIGQHFSSEGEATALKLGHLNRKVLADLVEVYAFPIKKEFLDYRKLILPAIEKRLHDSLTPKAGSNRV